VTDVEGLDVVKAMVMDAIANDYEPTSMVVNEVISWAKERGMTVAPEDVFRALTEFVHSGVAKAYRLSPAEPPLEVHSLSRVDLATDLYFLLTPMGHTLIKDY